MDRDFFRSKLFMVIMVVLLCAVIFLLIILKGSVFTEIINGDHSSSEINKNLKTITVDGVKYIPKDNYNILVIGLDDYEEFSSGTKAYRNDKCADFIAVISIDKKATNGKELSFSVLQINRDTVVDVTELGLNGRIVGSEKMQIALSHTYGDGLEQSSLNTLRAVKGFLYGIPIDYYVTLRMGAIPYLNLALGGVSVTLDEGQDISDFNFTNSTLSGRNLTIKSSSRLNDLKPEKTDTKVIAENKATERNQLILSDEALKFVRSRSGVEDQTNLSRMRRQDQYINGVIKKINDKLTRIDLEAKDENESKTQKQDYLYDLYTSISDYMLTDGNYYDVMEMFLLMGQYKFDKVETPGGESIIVNDHVQFKANMEDLKEKVIRLFLNVRED